MKYLLLLLFYCNTACATLNVLDWTAPGFRENGSVLLNSEICCYEIRGINAAGKSVWLVIIDSDPKVTSYTYMANIPDVLGVVSYEIACEDKNGLYSEFVNLWKRKKLLAPTQGEII